MPLTLVEFYDLLARHDWSFNYSDDHRTWEKGKRTLEHIQFVMLQNEEYTPVFRDLFNEYREWFFDASGDVVKPKRPEEEF